MQELVNASWKLIEEEYEKYFKTKDISIEFHNENKKKYEECFTNLYQYVMDRYMVETEVLDSHKQAAIITISCLQSKVIVCKPKENEICIAPQVIAISVALSYMGEYLNEILKQKRLPSIKEYIYPVAIACDTPYMEIMSRILYREEHDEELTFNVLELADRYFLLEYINLLQHGIEPSLLKE